MTERQLASIPKDIHTDYSELSGGSLEKATIDRLLKELHITYQAEDINIHLPHFQMQVDGKRGRSACEHFQTIQIKILADGVAVSGEKPSLTLKSPCIIGENNYIQSLQIPIAMFLEIQPSQMTTRPVEYNQNTYFFIFYDRCMARLMAHLRSFFHTSRRVRLKRDKNKT